MAARSLRVVAVTPLYPPESRVGAWLTTHEFLRHLAAKGHDVHVVAYMGNGAYDIDGVHVHPRACNPDEVLAGCDVMISHLGDNQQAAGEAEDRGLPLVRMVHGITPTAHMALEDFPCALAVFNSHSLADAIHHDCPSIVAHPPADLDQVRVDKPGGRVTLVNLSPEKGGGLFWRLAKDMNDVPFLAVRGGYGNQLTPHKLKNVQLVGPIEDMRDVYRQTRILLVPSEAETWGRVGLEAMASGIPVIAHPTPGLRESLGDAASFIDRADTAAWATEVRRLMRPAEWSDASDKARAHAARFDPLPELERFRKALVKVVS